MKQSGINRRQFMQLAAMSSMGLSSHELFAATAAAQTSQRIVVLVELQGGNDGFNTLVPYTDPMYYKHRPTLAVLKRQVLKLNDAVGLHPQMKAIMPAWEKGEMAWVQGLGYPNTVLSHFRSMDIWDAGSLNMADVGNGWLNRIVPRMQNSGLHGVSIDHGQAKLGPLSGAHMNSVTMQDPRNFLRQVRNVDDVKVTKQTPALAHVTQVQHQLFQAGKELSQKMHGKVAQKGNPAAKGSLGHSLDAVSEMIRAGISSPVYKVTQNGFDTHANQRMAHGNALYHLAQGLQQFRAEMMSAGLWDRVLVVTYSEFGRRMKENKAGGTDHGTASAHLLMGGQVKGGIYGRAPDLSRLDENGNVHHTEDFRSLYASVLTGWWKQANPWGVRTFPVIT